jgi:hypothetical protein
LPGTASTPSHTEASALPGTPPSPVAIPEQNPQKIPELAIRKHCSNENPSHSGRKPCRLVFQ